MTSPSRNRPRALPRVEQLEGRDLMSASVLFDAGSRALIVKGTESGDVIRIGQATGPSRQAQISVTIRARTGGLLAQKTVPAGRVRSVTVRALGGDDKVINETAVRSVLFGGAGGDALVGGSADDVLHGEAGDDALHGGGGKDRLYGSAGADWLFGGAGDDRLWGQAGADRLFGEAGLDRLFGEAGGDWLDGGLDDRPDVLNGGRDHSVDHFLLGAPEERTVLDWDADKRPVLRIERVIVGRWAEAVDETMVDEGPMPTAEMPPP